MTKRGGYADFRNQYRRGRANFLMTFVKKGLVFMWFHDSGVPTGLGSREGR